MMPSPMTCPYGVVGTYCLALLTSQPAGELTIVSDSSFSASGPLM